MLRTDRGGEYESNPFNSFCEDHGIIHETTPTYSPESNGVAKRKNKTLKEIMNSMLVISKHPWTYGDKLSYPHVIFKIEYLIIKLVKLLMNCGKVMLLI